MTGCPVVVRGKAYPTIKDAAKACGRSEKQAHTHLNRYGHLDHLGLKISYTREDRRRAVQIAHLSFPSVTAAAEALGVDRKTIRNARTRAAARDYLLRAVMRYTTLKGTNT
jgi:hypothetical protein